jgi:hypothetical protein
MTLQELPNIGPRLAENLRQAGLETPESFRAAGGPGCLPSHPGPGGPYGLLSPAHRPGRGGAGHPQKGNSRGEKGGPQGLFRQLIIESPCGNLKTCLSRLDKMAVS